MNRTITMNLSGIIFHIEEDAYEMLNNYLSTIRSYFHQSEGRDEIMNDIESRIAEMLQEKVSKTKQAVLMNDVEQVIAVMGKPEDFAGEHAEDHESEAGTNKGQQTNTAYSQSGRRRRVFRDTDDKMLGGVCSGIGTYFDFDPIWLRGAFAVSFFVFGTGLLLYIILWIIMPEAKTTAEKLEMRGEKVDVNNISKAVNEEFEEFKKKVKKFGDEVGSKENKERVRSTAHKFADFVAEVAKNIGKMIGKIFAVFFTVLSIVLIVALLSSVFGSANVVHISRYGEQFSFSLWDLGHRILPESMNTDFVMIGLLLFIGIPLISIIYSGVKFLLGIRQKNRIVKYTFNILWLVGLGILIVNGIDLMSDFSEDANIKQSVELNQHDTLYLSMQNYTPYSSAATGKRHFKIGNIRWNMVEDSNGKDHFNCPVELNIIPSETDSFQLTEIKMASGANLDEAGQRARKIHYDFQQVGSELRFDPSFQLDKTDKWRDQEVKLILRVPLNKVIYLSRGMEAIIYNIENVSNTWDSKMVGRRWIMKREGLTCVDCNGLLEEDELPPPPLPPAPAPANN